MAPCRPPAEPAALRFVSARQRRGSRWAHAAVAVVLRGHRPSEGPGCARSVPGCSPWLFGACCPWEGPLSEVGGSAGSNTFSG